MTQNERTKNTDVDCISRVGTSPTKNVYEYNKGDVRLYSCYIITYHKNIKRIIRSPDGDVSRLYSYLVRTR